MSPVQGVPGAAPGVRVTGQLKMPSAGIGGRALVSPSHDGAYVAVVYPAARQYVLLYRQGVEAWQE